MAVTDLAGANTGLRGSATRFAASAVIKLVGRPHLDIFHQSRIKPPGISLRIKLLPSANQFVCICPPLAGQNAVQEQFKVVIQNVFFIIRTKKLVDSAELSIRKLLLEKNIRIRYSKVQVKHLTIPANVTTQDIDGIYDGTLPDLVIVGLVSDEDFDRHYNRNPFNFQSFNVNCIEMLRNGMRTPRYGYTPKFANNEYIKDYNTFLSQLNFHKGDKNVALTPEEWAIGYTLYAFKTTDRPIGPGAQTPRLCISSGKRRLSIGYAIKQPKHQSDFVFPVGQVY